MHNGKYVLAQLLDFIDKDVHLRISNKYNGNRHVKEFTCWNQWPLWCSDSCQTVKASVMLSLQRNTTHNATYLKLGLLFSLISLA